MQGFISFPLLSANIGCKVLMMHELLGRVADAWTIVCCQTVGLSCRALVCPYLRIDICRLLHLAVSVRNSFRDRNVPK